MTSVDVLYALRVEFIAQHLEADTAPVVPVGSAADITLWKVALGEAELQVQRPFHFLFAPPARFGLDDHLADPAAFFAGFALPVPKPGFWDWAAAARLLEAAPGTEEAVAYLGCLLDTIRQSLLPDPALSGKSARMARIQRPRLVFVVRPGLAEFARQLQPIDHPASQRSPQSEARLFRVGWPKSSRVSVVGAHECPHLISADPAHEDYPEAHDLTVRMALDHEQVQFLSDCPCRPSRAPVHGTIIEHYPQFGPPVPLTSFFFWGGPEDSDE